MINTKFRTMVTSENGEGSVMQVPAGGCQGTDSIQILTLRGKNTGIGLIASLIYTHMWF